MALEGAPPSPTDTGEGSINLIDSIHAIESLGRTEERLAVVEAASEALLQSPELRASLFNKADSNEAAAILAALPGDNLGDLASYIRQNYLEGVYLALLKDSGLEFIYVDPVNLPTA